MQDAAASLQVKPCRQSKNITAVANALPDLMPRLHSPETRNLIPDEETGTKKTTSSTLDITRLTKSQSESASLE